MLILWAPGPYIYYYFLLKIYYKKSHNFCKSQTAEAQLNVLITCILNFLCSSQTIVKWRNLKHISIGKQVYERSKINIALVFFVACTYIQTQSQKQKRFEIGEFLFQAGSIAQQQVSTSTCREVSLEIPTKFNELRSFQHSR